MARERVSLALALPAVRGMRFLVLFLVLAGLLIAGVHTLFVHSGRDGSFPNNWGGWMVVAVIGLVVIGLGLLTAAREWRHLDGRAEREHGARIEDGRSRADGQRHGAA